MPKPVDLKDGILALKICLKKSWAKKATYWIEIWQVPLKINQQVTKTQWVCARSWKFPRKDPNTGKMEEVDGSLPGEGKSSFYLAFEQAVTGVAIQLEKDYTIDVVTNNIEAVTKAYEQQEVLEEVKKAMRAWSTVLNKPIPLVYMDGSALVFGDEKPKVRGRGSFKSDVPKELPKSPFKEAQNKRAKKARW